MIFVFQDIFDRSHIQLRNRKLEKRCGKVKSSVSSLKCSLQNKKEPFCSAAPLWDEKWTGTDGISWQQQPHVLTLVEQFLSIWSVVVLKCPYHVHFPSLECSCRAELWRMKAIERNGQYILVVAFSEVVSWSVTVILSIIWRWSNENHIASNRKW